MQIIALFIYLRTEPLNISILKLILETRGQTIRIISIPNKVSLKISLDFTDKIIV